MILGVRNGLKATATNIPTGWENQEEQAAHAIRWTESSQLVMGEARQELATDLSSY